jgi:hypothetical protein
MTVTTFLMAGARRLRALSPCHLSGLTSQRLISRSPLPDASVLPSGLKATQVTLSVCPLRVAFSWPVAAAQA